MQKNGAGLHTASSCFWDNTTDGLCFMSNITILSLILHARSMCVCVRLLISKRSHFKVDTAMDVASWKGKLLKQQFLLVLSNYALMNMLVR